MSEWRQKRFWKAATVQPVDGHFGVTLDGRQLKTPLKVPLLVPSLPMAEAIAREWDAQEEVIDPLSMPVTRTANAAIDKVMPQRAEVAGMLAAYGDSDLLCYRADGPEALIDRQAACWDPALDWAAERYGARLLPRTGVMHAPQSPEALARLSAEVESLTPFALAAFHDLVSLTGSLVLGLAACEDWRPAPEIWALSRLDEIWQAEQWGTDDEAEAVAARREGDFLHAKRFFDMARPT